MTVAGSRVLVTGSTSGIGEAIAERFILEGAEVVVTGRDQERGARVAERLRRLGPSECLFVSSDLATIAGPATLAAAAEELLGGIDVLVNNAGIYKVDGEPLTSSEFDEMMHVNVRGTHLLSTALMAGMAERGRGVVINITSPVAYRGYPGMAAYAATKAAMDMLTKCWAAEYGVSGIRVNALSPGPVITPGVEKIVGPTVEDVPKEILARTGLVAGRVGTGRDISAAVVFLAGSEASYITGTTAHIDGGMNSVGSLWGTHDGGTEPSPPADRSEHSVSVIVAVLNRAETLQRCLDSVFQQQQPGIQLIVMDGESTDGTLDVIRSNESLIDHWESAPDNGIYDAWNKALKYATGRWVCFLGADDYFLDKKSVGDLVRVGEEEDADLVCGRVWYVDANGHRRFTLGSPFEWKRMKRSHSIAHTGMLHRRQVFDRCGSFDPNMRIAGDYDFLLRLGPEVRAAFLDRVYLAMGDAGVSSRNLVEALREVRTIQARHSEIGRLRARLNYLLSLSAHLYWSARRMIDSNRVVEGLKLVRNEIRQGG
jgi:NAD(P)-dependent dehydrogenase (short-subunit alcohol dehydrogenase family)/glycosyltransferase involved in cell wall biosynthesis